MSRALPDRLEAGLGRLDERLNRRAWYRPVAAAALVGIMFVPALVPNLTLAAMGVVALGVLVLLCRRDEQTAITVLLVATFLVPANQLIKPLGQVGPPGLLIAAVMLGLWMCTRILPGIGGDRGRQPVRWLAFASLAAVLASYVAGQLRGLGPLESSGADAALISQASVLGLLLFLADTVRTLGGVRRVLTLLTAGGAVLAVAGELQFFGIVDLAQVIRIPGLTVVESAEVSSLDRSGFHRIQGFTGHPIEFGVVLGMLLPIAMHLALTAPRERRLLAWTMFALIGSGLPFAISRSAILTAGVSMVIYVLHTRLRTLLNMLPLLVVGVLAMQGAAPGLLGSIRSLFAFGNVAADPSIEGRTDDYSYVLHIWDDHRVLGIGPGTYIPSLYRILDNQYLYTLVTGGIVGLAALVALFATGYTLGRRVRRQAQDRVAGDAGHAIAAAIAGGAVASLTFDALGFKVMFVLTHLLVGLSGALWRVSVRDAPPATAPAAGLPTPSGVGRAAVPA